MRKLPADNVPAGRTADLGARHFTGFACHNASCRCFKRPCWSRTGIGESLDRIPVHIFLCKRGRKDAQQSHADNIAPFRIGLCAELFERRCHLHQHDDSGCIHPNSFTSTGAVVHCWKAAVLKNNPPHNAEGFLIIDFRWH